MGSWLRCGLCFGAGALVGAAAVLILSKNSDTVRKGMTSVLSHSIELKDKVKDKTKDLVASAKESLEDLAAEAKHESEKRRKANA